MTSKSTIVVRPTEPGDLVAAAEAAGRPLRERFKGLTILIDGEIEGVLGFLFRDPAVFGVAEISNKLRAHPVTLHKAGTRLMRWARESGLRVVVSEADVKVPRSVDWLERFGYRRVPGTRRMVWRAGSPTPRGDAAVQYPTIRQSPTREPAEVG